MAISRTLVALAAAASQASATYQGFNYGSTFTNGSPKQQSDFESEFKTAAGLDGTDGGFTSARFYTMIQAGTTNDPIQGIPAAISTKTSMLFGMWASAGQDAFNNELAALQKTLDQYCDGMKGMVAGISVGSEDLYRITPTGIANKAGVGAGPDTLVHYISQVRDAIKGSCLSDVPIGHVDTWTAYVNGSNSGVIEACDWLGMDAYPYFETTLSNSIDNGKDLFQSALGKTQGVSGGKPVWITETGWPVSGSTSGDAVPSLKNARTYWEEVACPLFGETNTWWYTLQDAAPDTPNPSFGVIGSSLTEKPLYDLSCKGVSSSSGPGSSSSTQSSKPSTAQSSSSPSTSAGGSGSGSSTQPMSSASSPKTQSSPASSSMPGNTTVKTSVIMPTTSAGSGSGAGNGGGQGGSTPTTTAMTSVVVPTTSSGSGSGSGGQGGSGNGTTAPSSTSSAVAGGSAGNRLDSVGAVAVAMMAAVLL